MVLTDRQRSDLHAGIYEYLLSRGPEFGEVALSLAKADPEACKDASSGTPSKKAGSSGAPVLEKKWTAVPRLQRRVLELERQIATNAKIHAHRSGSTASSGGSGQRRMLPRPPAAHLLQSHAGVVTSVAVHPIFTMAASGSEDGTVKLWDHESGEYLRTLRGHTNVVTCVDFSPSGSYLASTSTDLSVKLWDVREFSCVRTLRGHDHTISCVRFVPPPLDALYLDKGAPANGATGGFAGAEAAAGGGGGGVDPGDIGAKFLVTASRDATIKFWDLETGFCDHTISDHGDWIRCIAVRPAGGAPGNPRPEPKSSPANDGPAEAQEGGGEGPPVFASSSLALIATSGNDRTIYVYDAHDKRTKVTELRGHDHVVESLSFLCAPLLPKKGATAASPRSATGASNTWDYLASGGRDRTVRLWTVAGGGSCLMVFRAHENWVRGVMVHPSGNHLLSCGDDRTIRVFDIKSQRCLRTIEDAHTHFVTSISMHHTLPIMISGSVDHTVKCWQLD